MQKLSERMDASKLIRSNFVPVLLLILLVFGLAAISLHWPSGEDNASKVQAIAGLVGLIAAILVALMTWAYITTTHKMLEIQQATLDLQRPKIETRIIGARCGIEGPTPDAKRVKLFLVARTEFQNASLTTPTTLSIVRGGVENVGEQTLERAYFDDMDGTPNPNIHPLAAGQTIALNITMKLSVPNLRKAIPEPPIQGFVVLRDTFGGEWKPISFPAEPA